MHLLTIIVTILLIGHLWGRDEDEDDHEMSMEEVFKLLCAADEQHMEEIFTYCQNNGLKDAVNHID